MEKTKPQKRKNVALAAGAVVFFLLLLAAIIFGGDALVVGENGANLLVLDVLAALGLFISQFILGVLLDSGGHASDGWRRVAQEARPASFLVIGFALALSALSMFYGAVIGIPGAGLTTGRIIGTVAAVALAVMTIRKAKANLVVFRPRSELQPRSGEFADALAAAAASKKCRSFLHKIYPTLAADAEEGQGVKVVGEVEPSARKLKAPLSGRHCVAWQIELVIHAEIVTFSPNPSVAPKTVEASEEFFLLDNSGDALVQKAEVMLSVVRDHTVSIEDVDFDLPEVAELLEKNGYDHENIKPWYELREGVIEEGEEVAVWGVSAWRPDPEGGATYRGAELRLELTPPPDGGKLLISDDPWTTA